VAFVISAIEELPFGAIIRAAIKPNPRVNMREDRQIIAQDHGVRRPSHGLA